MAGTPIKNAKAALELFLRSLPIGSYFNVVSFGDKFHSLSEVSLEYTPENFDKISSKVAKLEANLGGTNLLNPLSWALNS